VLVPTPQSSEDGKIVGTTIADGGSSSGGCGTACWLVPLLIVLLLLLLLAAWFWYQQRQRDRRKNEVDSDVDFTGVGAFPAGAAQGATAGAVGGQAFAQGNPMFSDLALADKLAAETGGLAGSTDSGGADELVRALEEAKARGDLIRLFTNSPATAMLLSERTGSFVKCTHDGGGLLDTQVQASGFFRAVTAAFLEGRRSPKVKTDFKVLKRDEWTAHTDPCSDKIYFYNGKLNKVVYNAAAVEVTKTAKAEPLRWEFAPDEFDNFDKFLAVLKQQRWTRKEDLHVAYFVNSRNQDRVWIE
jgi:hypothetical protein